MSRITRYILAELIPPLLAGVLLFTALLSFGYFFVSSQWLQGVSPALVAQWLGYQLPDTLVKVLPMAAVLMTIVAFGRLNTDSELVAMQSGGIGLGQAGRPVAVTGLALALLSLWLSLWVAPRANVETRSLYWDVMTGAGLSTMSGRTLDLGGGLNVSWQSYDPATRQLQGVRAERWNKEHPQQADVVFAKTGTFEDNQLRLTDYQAFKVDYAAAAKLAPGTPLPGGASGASSNLLALRQQAEEINHRIAAVFPGIVVEADPAKPLEIEAGTSRKEAIARFADAIGADDQGWDELTSTINDAQAPAADRQDAALTLSRKVALPFGNLVLALAALPFALRFGRSLGVSLGMALLVALAYYLLTALGLTLAGGMSGPLALALPWLGNLVLLIAGLLLLRRA
ncbi:LptF/LptG family permease [Deinococcus sp. Marseille-Q6407]|uniref:LptF/LptG family permease n=1 Tax=Deinococcus sp. Marseille-Q6407 TaxID=2969223 RepID=UPI0021C215BF|nr:LptF/LptG family permease [Deinococcus sp. Marseille-Q6407]